MNLFTRQGRALLLAAVMAVGAVWLSGCGGGTKPPALVGHWVHESGHVDNSPDDIELFKDGTGVLDEDMSITWKVENKRLMLLNPPQGLAYAYNVSGSRLTLFGEDGDSVMYYIPVKCGNGNNFHNPQTQFCNGNDVVNKCGGDVYMLATQFCSDDDNIVNKCNGKEFDIANQRCQNNVIEGKCGDGWYKPATQFCSGGSPKDHGSANSGDDFDILQNAAGGITITKYRGTGTDVVIPATISNLKVTEIGREAFQNKKLENVILPEFVTIIGDNAFDQNLLTSVFIPNSVSSIGNRAFSYNKLTTITIPNSVKTIGYSAFAENALKHVMLGRGIEEITHEVFAYNSIESVIIPNSVLRIGSGAFSYNNLTSVTFGNRVEIIGKNAFAHNKLTELTNLPASVEEIWIGAFCNNSISKLVLPNNRNLAFAGGRFAEKAEFENNPITTLVVPAALAERTKRSVGGFITGSIGSALGNSSKTLTTISMPANAPLNTDSRYGNLISNLPNNFAAFYESQNRKAGTYNWDGRLWSVQ